MFHIFLLFLHQPFSQDPEIDESDVDTDRGYAWWQKTLMYHVYVPSFYDSNGDGFGDLKGEISVCLYFKFERACLVSKTL